MNDLISAIKLNLNAPEPKKFNAVEQHGHLFALVITMVNDHTSIVAARKCLQSIKQTKSKLLPLLMDATTPQTLNEDLSVVGLTLNDWSFPKSPAVSINDVKTGMKLTGYAASDYTKVVSCLVSHMKAWTACVEINQPIVILEHDALFVNQFDPQDVLEDFSGGALGLNDPRRATRRSMQFLQATQDAALAKGSGVQVVDAPWVDEKHIPQGLAGNSAYIIKPEAAQQLLDKIQDIGMWPNDALMCKQLFPWLQVTYPFYTQVQGVKSTTTL